MNDEEFGAGLPRDAAVTLPPGASHLEILAGARGAERREAVDRLIAHHQFDSIEASWNYVARDGQRTPPGSWRNWLIMAGRGFGKTRAGAEWVRAKAETDGRVRIALVAATLAEARAVMVEGDSGLIAIGGRLRPRFERSTNRIWWENGAQAQLYSAGEPESLRGPQHHFAWCDEIGKWSKAEAAWDMLAFGLRLGAKPQTVVTTTPRPIALLKRLLAAEAGGATYVTRGRTADNRAHLAETFLADIEAQHAGTRLGRQELDGELIEDLEGALWTRDLIERCRTAAAPEAWTRVVIGVDPPAGAGAMCDLCGIVAAALGADGRAYVIEDASIGPATPERWARAVAGAAARHGADCVVAEANNGGAMVESVLRAADAGLPIRLVHASHGKSTRAEPVMLLYEAGRVAHAGDLRALEDQMAGFIGGGDYQGPGNSPDRADALVWALTELMLGPRARRPGVRRL